MRVYYKFEIDTLLCAFLQLIFKLSNHIYKIETFTILLTF